jgi:CubicO group peptidase (beta-lactamase class C family)
MRNFLYSSFATLCFFTLSVSAQSPSLDEAKELLDVWLEAQLDYERWPSLSVSFVDGQKIIYAKSFGYSNKKGKVKATPDTLYSICSNSKMFTAISLMQLRDQDKLSLRDPVSKYLDWYDIEQSFPLSGEVTIEGILSHSSGLPREVDVPYWSTSADFPFPSLQKTIEITKDQKTLYRAWDRFQYSNLGLTLAGEIVANVSGQNYHKYVLENVLNPLGLNNTFSTMERDKYGKALAIGYESMPRYGERKAVKFFNAGAIDPAAGFTSSANDLAKFLMWQIKLQNGEGDEVLSHNSLREMQRPHGVMLNWEAAVGLGFFMRKFGDKTMMEHGGSCPGYRSQAAFEPKQGIGGVALINAGGTNPNQLIDRMMDIFSPILKASVDKENASEQSNGNVEFDDYSGIYDSQPWGGESYFMSWGGQLVEVNLKSSNPLKSMTKFKHIKGDTFRVLKTDGKEAHTITFIRDHNKIVNSVMGHSNIALKIK